MQTQQLKEYLGIVVDMEKSIYLMDKVTQELKQRIEPLGINRPIRVPQKESCEYKGKGPRALILTVLAFIAASYFFAGFMNGSFSDGVEYTLLFLTIPFCIYLFMAFSDDKGNRRACKQAEEKYNSEMRMFAECTRADHERVERELRQKAYFESSLKQLEAKLSDSRICLQKIYAKNIIFPKYRNLVMVCSMYEYICAGRCTALEGSDGAYNILEMEIRLDRIITQLDSVIANLERVQKNQFMLYTAISESNQQIAHIVESTNHVAIGIQSFHGEVHELDRRIAELQKTSEITAYQEAQAQKELRYMNRMNYLSGRNDDVFWNVPPSC